MSLHQAEFTTLDITMAQAKLLYVLVASGEMTLSETARHLGVTASTASGAVDHLVNLGLVSRTEDPANRRQVRVAATATGADTLEQMRDMGTRQMQKLFELVTDKELEVVQRAITILAEAADATQTTPPAPTTRAKRTL